MTERQQNVFAGSNAMREFLQPANSTPTSLVELPNTLNPFLGDKVHIFAKNMFLMPLLNIKQLVAFNLLETAQTDGELEGVHTLVENSSGNMVLGLAVLAPYFGISHVVAVLSRDIAPNKLEILRLFGVDIEFSDAAPKGMNGIAYAKKLGQQDGWLNLAQYENDANPVSYEKYLAPQLWEQTGGELTIFCAGLGTSGTVIGTARYLKKQSPTMTVVGVLPAHDSVPGVRSEIRIKESSLSWEKALDYKVEVKTKDAFTRSFEMCRLGILAGPSGGMALAGLLDFLKEQKDAGTLDKFRNASGEVVAAFINPDSMLPYLEKYSTYLGTKDFQEAQQIFT